MELGFASMNGPDDLDPAELGRALEERGFTSLWMGEHAHIPATRITPYPLGGELPAAYRQMMDPLSSLLVAARATERLRVGTAVALPLEHDVFALAKAVATIDRLTSGRFELGVGVGWNVEELADHRPEVPWGCRYSALEDCVAALRALWTQPVAEHRGRWFGFGPAHCDPKPIQVPHPPVLAGVSGRVGIAHAVRWADGWLPMEVAGADVRRRLEGFRAVVAAAGREPLPISVVVWGDPTPEFLQHLAQLGVHRAVLGPGRSGWESATSPLAFLDRYAGLAPSLLAGPRGSSSVRRP